MTVRVVSEGAAQSSIDYRCDECGRRYSTKADLLAKRAVFVEMGESGKTVRSRVVAWLCKDSCIPEDPDWNREALAASHGFQHTRMARETETP